MARLPGTPYSIAAGFACGAAISFTPFVGLHFVLGGILAWIIRSNIIASAIGTAVGNPWTFPFIWLWVHRLGTWLGAGRDSHIVADLNFSELFGAVLEAMLNFDFTYLIDTAAPVLWPMFVGSIPTAIVAWIFFYLPLKPLVANYQKRRHRRRMRRNAAMKPVETEP
jgi:uncharacterized protein (DUF2062 family)